MQFGSIHRNEDSARHAVAMLMRAGIEPTRVKLLGPRIAKQGDGPPALSRTWKTRARDVLGGIGLGASVGVLLSLIVAVAQVRFFVLDPIRAFVAILAAAAFAGVAASIFVPARPNAAHSTSAVRTRQLARGWAVVVNARDAEQRALVARLLANASSAHPGPVAA